jgi:hypothetical protein
VTVSRVFLAFPWLLQSSLALKVTGLPCLVDRLRQAGRDNVSLLSELNEEAIVDAYDESEPAVGFYTLIEEHLAASSRKNAVQPSHFPSVHTRPNMR